MLKLFLVACAAQAAVAHFPFGHHGDHHGHGDGGHHGRFMKMHKKKCAIGSVGYLLHCEMTEAEGQPSVSHLECNAEKDDTERCLIPGLWLGNVTDVALTSVHEGECVQDKTYGVMEGQGVWVKDGCSATFSYVMKPNPDLCEKHKHMLEVMECGAVLRDLTTCKPDIQENCVCHHGKKRAQETQEVDAEEAEEYEDREDREDGEEMMTTEVQRQREGEDEEGEEGRHGRHGPHGKHGPWGPHGRHGRHGRRHPFRGYYAKKAAFLGWCLKKKYDKLSEKCQVAAKEIIPAMLPHRCPMKQFLGHHMESLMLLALLSTFIMMCGAAIYFFLVRTQKRAQRIQLEQMTGPRLYTGRWSTSLFHFDVFSCLPSCLFPWCQSALNQAEVHGRDAACADVLFNTNSHSLVNNIYNTRQAIKYKYNIAPTETVDCLTSVFCGPCAMAQHTREMEIRSAGQMQAARGTVKEVDGVPLLQSTVPVQAKVASDTMY